MKKYLIILIPLVTGYLTSFFCSPKKNTDIKNKATPPSYVFAIIWPILYLCIGYSWYLIYKKSNILNYLFILNTSLSILWLILFSCIKNKKLALYNLIAMICSSMVLIIFTQKYSLLSSCLLVPYFSWLIFALLLNYSSVNNS